MINYAGPDIRTAGLDIRPSRAAAARVLALAPAQPAQNPDGFELRHVTER